MKNGRHQIRKTKKLFSIIRSMNALWITALCNGVAAGVEHGAMLLQVAPKYVVDIGANRGQFALAVRGVLPNTRVVSFEPLPAPAAIFSRLFHDDRNVVLHSKAIGPRSETCSMYMSKSDDSSSLLPISSLQTDIFPGTEFSEIVEVGVATLDEFYCEGDIPDDAMLKLDVQGYELDTLRGCDSLLSQFCWVYCECSFIELYSGQSLASDVIEWLSSRSFRIKGIYNSTYDVNGIAVQADFLFERAELVGTQ